MLISSSIEFTWRSKHRKDGWLIHAHIEQEKKFTWGLKHMGFEKMAG